MSNSAWDETIVVKGAGLPEGQYLVKIIDIIRENKVVQNRVGLGGKGIVTKEYDSLTAEQKAIVDATPEEFWPVRATDKDQTPRKKIAFIDQYRFVFNEPASGTDLKFGAEFDINRYDAVGNRIGGGKALTDFITRATGAPIEAGDEVKLTDYFKPGDEFVVTLVKNGSFTEMDPNSIMKKELSKPVVKGKEALSVRATTMLEFLKANYQGRPKRDIVDLYGSGQFGTYAETTAAWQEIMKNVSYSKDNKTLDFSEA
jgi:hypothetical protein